MPLKIEPMREEDYLQMGKEVKEGFDDGNVFMPASLNSPSIFGSVEAFSWAIAKLMTGLHR